MMQGTESQKGRFRPTHFRGMSQTEPSPAAHRPLGIAGVLSAPQAIRDPLLLREKRAQKGILLMFTNAADRRQSAVSKAQKNYNCFFIGFL